MAIPTNIIDIQRRMFMQREDQIREMEARMQHDALSRIGQSQGLLGGLGGQSLTDQLSKYNTNDYSHALDLATQTIDNVPMQEKEEFTHEINYDNSLEGELKKWRKGWLE